MRSFRLAFQRNKPNFQLPLSREKQVNLIPFVNNFAVIYGACKSRHTWTNKIAPYSKNWQINVISAAAVLKDYENEVFFGSSRASEWLLNPGICIR